MEQYIKYFEDKCLNISLVENKEKHVKINGLRNYIYALLMYSSEYKLRCYKKPYGELYTTLEYTKDYVIKLIEKKGWGGYIVSITYWDFFVVDIDKNNITIEEIEQLINDNYPEELFIIHKTNNGYHLYMMSKLLNSFKRKSVEMKNKLMCDVAYTANSFYTGNSLRLCLKPNDNLEKASIFVKYCGNGKMDNDCKDRYETLLSKLEFYKNFTTMNISCSDNLRKIYDYSNYSLRSLTTFKSLNTYDISIGLNQILCSEGLKIEDSNGHFYIQSQYEKFNSISYKKIWNKFVNYRTFKKLKINDTYVEIYPLLMILCSQNMSYNNLYRIIEDKNSYAIGYHLQESLKFIVYKELLFIDYDNKSKLQILATFCRYHPEYCFRVVKSLNGYHAFLTSKKIPYYNHKEVFDLLTRLCSDPMHILTCLTRGYSLRINQKNKNDINTYKEYVVYGKGEEIQELVDLYKLHYVYYDECVKNKEPIYKNLLRVSNIMFNEHINDISHTL